MTEQNLDSSADTNPPKEVKKGIANAKVAAKQVAAQAAKQALAQFKAVSGLFGKIILGLRSFAMGLLHFPLILVRGSFSSRLLFLAFLSSLVLLIVSGIQIFNRFIPKILIKREQQSQTQMGGHLGDFFQLQKQFAIESKKLVYLEEFSAFLNSESGHIKAYNIEIYAECDRPETSALLKARFDEMREVVSGALQGQKYEVLLTPQGKEQFKKHIALTINNWIKKKKHEGHVTRLFFTILMMGE